MQWMEKIFSKPAKEGFALKLRRCTCAAMLWEIWKERCSNRYGNILGSINKIITMLDLWIKDLAWLLKEIPCRNEKEIKVLHNLQLHNIQYKFTICKIIYWKRPPHQHFKLNVDGASKGNPGHSGGGGLIRDDAGRFVVGFSHYYAHGSNMCAEFRAIRDGIYLFMDLDLDLKYLQIETDPKVLVDMFAAGS